MTTARTHRLRPASPLLVLALAWLALVLVLTPGVTAHASGDAESELTSMVNAERAAAGLPALPVSGDLVDVARRHSSRMASSGTLQHNPHLGSEVSNWTRVTENVGRGPAARAIHDALMASSSHRANILDGAVQQIGVGIVVAGDTLWVTQVFRQPATASPAPPPPPADPTPPPPSPPAAQAPPSAPATPATPSAGAPPAATETAPERSAAGMVVAPADAGSVRLASPVVVDTAADGAVHAAPSPEAARVLTTARWITVAWLLVE